MNNSLTKFSEGLLSEAKTCILEKVYIFTLLSQVNR